jgi:RecJ-like exonuclease
MSKVNDWSIELKEMVTSKCCHICDGEGVLEVDVPRGQGFGRDSGYLDTREEVCDMCDGSGQLELDDEDE